MKPWVLCGDMHVPYQSPEALSLLFELVRDVKPVGVVLLGDIVDFYQLSRFDKRPERLLKLQEDLDAACGVLADLRRNLKRDKPIYYIEGNHELRLERWVNRHPEISSLRSLDLQELLGMEQLGVRYIRWHQILEVAPGFIATHGEFVRKWGGQTAVAQMMRYQTSGVSGHSHRLSITYWRGLRTLTWAEAGCLCSRFPDWTPLPDWHHGVVLLDAEGPVKVSCVPFHTVEEGPVVQAVCE